MKTFKYLLLYFLLLNFNFVFADKVEVNGVYYNLNADHTAEVTYRGDEEDGWMYFQSDELYVGDLMIPDTFTYNGNVYTVTSIGNDAFAGSKQMTSLSIPKSVTEMGTGMFSLCGSLESIKVSDSNAVYFSQGGILYQRSPLVLFFVPRALQGEVTLNDGLTEIPSSAFQGCTTITSVTIPDKVTTIADGAFYQCISLQEVNLDSSLTTIGEYAFGKCTGLELVSIPGSVKTIRSCAFSDCTGLYYVLLHEGLTDIGKMAFYNCQNIIGIQLPGTLTSIADQAFDGCYSLDVVQNNSGLNVVAGETTNGYVAYYASQVEQGSTGILQIGKSQPTVYKCGEDAMICNAQNLYACLYNLEGKILYAGKINTDVKAVHVGCQRVLLKVMR